MSDIWASYVKMKNNFIGCDNFSKHVYNNHYQRILFNRRGKETSIRFVVKSLMGKILFDDNKSFVTNWKYCVNRKVFDESPIINIDDNKIFRFGNQKVAIKHKNFQEVKINLKDIDANLKLLKELEEQLRGLIYA